MKKDHPGVYIPPPIIYALVFFAAVFLNKLLPIAHPHFKGDWIYFVGIIFILAGMYLGFRGLGKFIQGGNTLVTMKPAKSLQEGGIYKFTRNPMYFGLILLYLGFACFYGNWWHLILLPLLVLIMQEYVIKREERYLEREFGDTYKAYRGKVRRWI